MKLKDVGKRKFDVDELTRMLQPKTRKQAIIKNKQKTRQELSKVDPLEMYREYKNMKTQIKDLEHIVGLLRVKCRV